MRFVQAMLVAATLSLGVGVSGMGGCALHSSADPQRGVQGLMLPELPEDSWPKRSTEILTDLDAMTPEKLTLVVPYRLGASHDESDDECRLEASVVSHGVYGRGLIREFGELVNTDGSAGIPDELIIPPELLTGLQFVSYPGTAGPPADYLARLKTDQPRRYKQFMMRRLGLRGRDDAWTLGVRGTRMRLYEPTGSHAGKLSRGLVVHLSSLAGLEYELPTAKELTDRGWAVLIVNASTARKNEEPVFLDADADPSQGAQRFARMIDNRVAEIAYAAEAGVEYVAKNRPLIRTSPIVVIGYSAGALTAPAVVEALRPQVGAVVLVGGGANILDISQRSSLTNGGLELVWRNDRSTVKAIGRLNEEYLKHTKLDPYTLAPRLADKPALMLHCMNDDIVPTDAGDLLYNRLGRPERFSFPIGHRALFWLLPSQAGRIANWVDEAVEPAESHASLRVKSKAAMQ